MRIPLAEIESRTLELPPKGSPLKVADTGAEAYAAAKLLNSLGRPALVVPVSGETDVRPHVRLWDVNEFLLRCVQQLELGVAIDVGCGSGRDCVALASLGWTVHGYDRLESAVEQARALASRYLSRTSLERVSFEARDVVKREGLHACDANGCFDLALMLFWWDPRVAPLVGSAVGPGGRVVVDAFSAMHRQHFGKPRTGFVNDVEDVAAAFPGFEPEFAEAGWANGRHTVRCLLRKVSG